MAKGDKYNVLAYAWQVRERADGCFFIRYDNEINENNKQLLALTMKFGVEF